VTFDSGFSFLTGQVLNSTNTVELSEAGNASLPPAQLPIGAITSAAQINGSCQYQVAF
jgi:hypothetical protein